MNSKHIWNLEVNDMVTIGKDIFFVTKITRTQYTVQKFGSDGSCKYHFERVMRRSGDVVGGNGWARVLEVTPEAWEAKIQEQVSIKKAESDKRQTAWEAKVAAVKAKNSDGHILITDEGIGGLKKAAMLDVNGKTMLVYFSVTEEEMWLDYSQPPVKGVRINCSTWHNDSWDKERYGFSHTDARGFTVEDALIDLVAGHYWN